MGPIQSHIALLSAPSIFNIFSLNSKVSLSVTVSAAILSRTQGSSIVLGAGEPWWPLAYIWRLGTYLFIHRVRKWDIQICR